MSNQIEFTRINNDVNGNPRYVCHFFNMLSDAEKAQADTNPEPGDLFGITTAYNMALRKAKKIGGRKFHNKQYGGGIAFQSYSLPELTKQINDLKNS